MAMVEERNPESPPPTPSLLRSESDPVGGVRLLRMLPVAPQMKEPFRLGGGEGLGVEFRVGVSAAADLLSLRTLGLERPRKLPRPNTDVTLLDEWSLVSLLRPRNARVLEESTGDVTGEGTERIEPLGERGGNLLEVSSSSASSCRSSPRDSIGRNRT